MNRILIAEDETRISSFLDKGLRAAGYATLVVHDGSSALHEALSDEFDLMVLDLGLPERDGFAVLRDLRGAGSSMPVVVLTARDGVEDTVAGLEGGADDYMAKPFRFEELLARVRLRLRSAGAPPVQHTLEHAGVLLDLRSRRLQVGERGVDLTAREFALAEVLLRHPGQVLSREQLLDRVWGHDVDVGSNVVETYVGYLRRKIGADRIETVRGLGYRLRA